MGNKYVPKDQPFFIEKIDDLESLKRFNIDLDNEDYKRQLVNASFIYFNHFHNKQYYSKILSDRSFLMKFP